MTDRLRFDPRALKALAGEKVYGRGEAYCRQGVVELLGSRPGRLVARVAGSENYHVILVGEGEAIGGECACPAFDREGFCKHMVAAALTANDAAGLVDDDSFARIRAYLAGKGIDALIDMIMEVAEREPGLLQRLEIGAAAGAADDGALKTRLGAVLRNATRTRDFIDHDDAGEWAGGVEAALDCVADLVDGAHAALAIELACEAIAQIEAAIEHIDNSDGHCGSLLERARGIHLAACRVVRPDPVALARDLFRHETEGEYDSFYEAAAQYGDVLGETGLAEYRRLAEAAWSKLPTGGGKRGSDLEGGLRRLMPILDFFAERDGDIDARIALRAKALASQWEYFLLAEFCREHGRSDEALRWAEEGLWVYEDDRSDQRLVLATVDLLLAARRKDDAAAHLWRAFPKAPSLTLYGRLRELGGDVAGRAIGLLEGRLAGEAKGWRHHGLVDTLIGVMIAEKMFDAAWRAVDAHGASCTMRETLAHASEATHKGQALAVYAERVEELAAAGGGPAYGEAAALIARIGRFCEAADYAAYLAGIRLRHGRKRTLMKLLE